MLVPARGSTRPRVQQLHLAAFKAAELSLKHALLGPSAQAVILTVMRLQSTPP